MEYSGKTVLITGASSGIGAALAREFAAQGANLVLTARRLDRLEALASELSRGSRRALALRADVSVDGELEGAVERARQEFGRIDVVVANAGFSLAARFDRLTLADYRRQFEVNVFGVLRTVYSTLEDLKKTRGRIVIIGSVAGWISLPENTAYSMSKAAILDLADGLSTELASAGVSVTHIMPGFIDTDIFEVNNQNVKMDSSKKNKPPKWLTMPADRAARQIVRAVSRRKRARVITLHGKALVLLQRLWPGLVSRVLGY